MRHNKWQGWFEIQWRSSSLSFCLVLPCCPCLSLFYMCVGFFACPRFSYNGKYDFCFFSQIFFYGSKVKGGCHVHTVKPLKVNLWFVHNKTDLRCREQEDRKRKANQRRAEMHLYLLDFINRFLYYSLMVVLAKHICSWLDLVAI